MEALFLVHEGYFGALGTFLQSAFGEDVDKILISG
jgi:pantothenate kinase